MNQSIKAKLLGGYIVILMLLISTAFFMTSKFSESNQRLLNIVDVSSKRISLSNELMIAVLDETRHEKNILMEKDPVRKDYYKDRIYKALETIDTKTSELDELVDDKGKVILNEFKTSWTDYKSDLNQIILLAMKNEDEQAFKITIDKGLKIRDAAITQIERLIDKNEKSMENDKIENNANYNAALNTIIALIIAGILLAIIISYWIIQSITKRISVIAKEAEKIASREFTNDKPEDNTNDELKPIFNSLISVNESFREVTESANNVASGDYEVDIIPRSDKDTLGNALKKMTRSLRETTAANEKHNWLTSGQNQLNEKLVGDQSIEELASNTISFLCTYLKANIGAVYLFNAKDNALMLNGHYAFTSPKDIKEKFALNEGLIGQAALEQKQISLTDITEEQIRITSSVLNTKPKQLLITPFLFEGKTLGVIEMGRLTDFTETEKEFINASMESIAVSINMAINQQSLRELLGKVQSQKGEMEIAALELDQQINALNQAAIVSITDANGDIIYINDKFCAISKYSREELLGKNHRILKSGKQPDGLFTGMWKSISLGKIWKGEIVNKAKDGTFYWVDTTITPFKGIDGKIEKYVSIRFEITITKNQMLELAQQAEELQVQQEELKQTNEELEEQTQNLKQQQEELQMTNEELEEQTQALEEKNKEVETAKYDIEQKTKQLEISSKYKSEFLANMSHELRTPLNSLLILSKDLSENRNKNLDEDQVESAEIIYNSGHDLLVLINEVLDLSKIEAGKMSVNIERVSLRNFTDELLRNFKHQAEQKGLKLTSKLSKELPESIHTDSQRLNQILKNILSNAIKFTEKGSVNIRIDRYTESTVIISITDTGIGIPEDKQMAIFEAFQQADGGTSRKYGGTGLGLSISRELAKLLGAEIKLSSKLNEGSTFSIIIPLEIHHEQEPARTSILKEPVLYKPQYQNDSGYLNYPSIEDDRDTITKDDKVVLIIEDDLKFASILLKLANKKGFKCLSAATGEDGLLLATKYKPQAVILDMELPGINGHNVLHELKENPAVRHIPVHIISANERSLEPIKEGAIEYLMKPVNKNDLEEAFNRIENFVNRKMKNLLIIEDNENARKAMRKLIGNGDVKCFEAGTGKDALALYQDNKIDCIILDIGLPDMTGFDLIYKLESLKDHAIPPIIIYTGKELTKEENNELQKYAESIIIKGVKSEERLLDETALFLHRTISNLPESKQMIINNLYDKEAIFHSKKILLVDDDMRNVFALSKILKERGMEIIKAENGKNALEMLDAHADIDLVLMDIMMPEMDGYEAMQRIRSQVKYKNLPVIALTAKAMNDDKQKCIDAGANDYIAKPVDVERLLSLMRVWLSK
ncbi:response regulator [Algoriphagus aquimarinus]|uniref:response regulator n=1 Tax=Algoriphagus aquimarinus TaxID=237018 RepID=UPI0030D82196